MSASLNLVMLNSFLQNEQSQCVMLNLFQHNTSPSPVILKQVQDDENEAFSR